MMMSRSKAAAIPRFIVPCVFFLAFATRPAYALDPITHISQYGHTAWRVRDGFLGGNTRAIAQTADGYLWIGTETGLLRFDGVGFGGWRAAGGKQVASLTIFSLLAARDGSLWIGTLAGLSHWVTQHVINFEVGRGAVNSILEDRNGTVWMSRTQTRDDAGCLCQLIAARMRCYGKSDGIPFSDGGALGEDTLGNLWMGSSTGLGRGKPGSFNAFTPSSLKSNQNLDGVMGVAVNPDGSVWAGIALNGPGLGLQQMVRGDWKPFVTPGLDGSRLKVGALFLDRENALWIGTYNEGMYRIHGREVDRFRSADGLSSDSVYGFFEDREGSLWVATPRGIDMFRDRPIATFSTREGLGTGEVDSVLASRDGTVWIGGDGALDALHQTGLLSIQAGKGLPGNQVTSLFEDHAGRLWVGIDTTLSLYTNGRFRRINRSDGSRMGMVTGITEDVDGTMWVVTNRPPRTLFRIQNLEVQEELPEPQIPPARAVAADPRGGIWLGLMNGDLARYRYGKIEITPFKHNLNSRVHQICVTSDGAVLGATTSGLIGWREGTQRTLTARNGLA